MALFEWDQQYSVGIVKIDEQHRRLVDMINELHDAIISAVGEPAVKSILDKLLDYTAYHFESEESLLKEFEYPDMERHKKDHDTLAWRVLDLRSRYESGEGVGAPELLDFLTGWLKNHILYSDKKYGLFLNAKGVH